MAGRNRVKGGGWVQNDQLDTDNALIPSICIKTSQFYFFVKADINLHFLSLFATFLWLIKIIIAIGGAKNGHPFFGRQFIEKINLHP